jgi:hypothetical protein
MKPEQPVETTAGAGGFSRDMGRAVDAPVASGNGFSMRMHLHPCTHCAAAGFCQFFCRCGRAAVQRLPMEWEPLGLVAIHEAAVRIRT